MSVRDQIRNRLHEILPALKQKYPIEKLGMFGSVMRSDFTQKSDIDILVEFNGDVGFDFFDLEKDLEIALGRKIDLVSLKAIKPHYLPYITKDLVYV